MTQPLIADAEPQSALEKGLVRLMRNGVTALPVLPQVAASALQLANDPKAGPRDLADLIDGDPPIAARFLSVANSAAYYRGYAAPTTRDAVIRLGLATTRDLLFQVVYGASTHGVGGFQAQVADSFKRSVLAGSAARLAAKRLGRRYEYDYMCGLLHDIGEARIYRLLAKLPPTKNMRLVRALVERYHTSAGAEIAMAWRLPAEIVDCCAAHHDLDTEHEPHVRLVMIADACVDALLGDGYSRIGVDPQRFARLGVDQDTAEALVMALRDSQSSEQGSRSSDVRAVR
ncbi:MAG: HDOD domain-containing protein [Myxococcales bacterium]|nr:HDOD domain-containing protein [Myxococcales bacterium]